MNKKGFTLIELLAVVVVLSILVMVTTPNVMNLIDNGKKKIYINDATEFIAKATYLYSQEPYKNNSEYFEKVNDNTYRIYLNKISSISDKKDSYGNEYKLDNSYVMFKEPLNNDGLEEVQKSVYIESCDKNNKCHYICNVNLNDLNTDSISASC